LALCCAAFLKCQNATQCNANLPGRPIVLTIGESFSDLSWPRCVWSWCVCVCTLFKASLNDEISSGIHDSGAIRQLAIFREPTAIGTTVKQDCRACARRGFKRLAYMSSCPSGPGNQQKMLAGIAQSAGRPTKNVFSAHVQQNTCLMLRSEHKNGSQERIIYGPTPQTPPQNPNSRSGG
jgi:hypothetical protein